MTVWLLIVTISGIPIGARYTTREECENDALKIYVVLTDAVHAKVECVERVKGVGIVPKPNGRDDQRTGGGGTG